jgi:Flp pilus assembly protein TadG
VRTLVRRLRSAREAEDGTALVEVTWLALLLLVPLVYLLVAVFDVQRASFGVSAAARAAARAYALAHDEASGRARAQQAAAVALRDQGLDPGTVQLAVSCSPSPGNCLAPGSVVAVRLSHQVRLPLAPEALGGGAPSFRVEADQRFPYGTFREDR